MENIITTLEDGKHSDIREIYLHVHTANVRAQHFYEKFGFVQSGTALNYYRGIEPPDAFVYRRAVNGAVLAELPPPPAALPTTSADGVAAPASVTA